MSREIETYTAFMRGYRVRHCKTRARGRWRKGWGAQVAETQADPQRSCNKRLRVEEFETFSGFGGLENARFPLLSGLQRREVSAECRS